ncbi:MAG: hypothetical protein HC922_06725 [Leptolyngbyaceae cyanobacterium SM2_3_12]|nr:hypothetical protein [Leptolyngbyaceae cyanobacterium SM2_3_12]
MNSLADLFESNPEGVADIWEEEDLDQVALSNMGAEAESGDWNADFADLLDTNLANQSARSDQNQDSLSTPEDDVASLFGYDLDGSSSDPFISRDATSRDTAVPADPSNLSAHGAVSPPAETPWPEADQPEADRSEPELLESALEGDLEEFFDLASPATASLEIAAPGLETDDFFSQIEEGSDREGNTPLFDFSLSLDDSNLGLDFEAEGVTQIASPAEQISPEEDDFDALFAPPVEEVSLDSGPIDGDGTRSDMAVSTTAPERNPRSSPKRGFIVL